MNAAAKVPLLLSFLRGSEGNSASSLSQTLRIGDKHVIEIVFSRKANGVKWMDRWKPPESQESVVRRRWLVVLWVLAIAAIGAAVIVVNL